MKQKNICLSKGCNTIHFSTGAVIELCMYHVIVRFIAADHIFPTVSLRQGSRKIIDIGEQSSGGGLRALLALQRVQGRTLLGSRGRSPLKFRELVIIVL